MSLMYLDDGLVASTDSEMLESFMKCLRNEFKITEQDGTYFLGFQITQMEDGSITVSQAACTRKLLKKFDREECKPDSKPHIWWVRKKFKNNSKSKMEELPNIECVEELILYLHYWNSARHRTCSRESILFTRKTHL